MKYPLSTRRLQDRCGPVFSAAETAKYLRVSVRRIQSMDRRGLLLAFDRKGRRCYPVFQFDRSSVRPFVAAVINSFKSQDAALHHILVPRRSRGWDGTCQPYLNAILTNDYEGVADMIRRAHDLGTDGYGAKAKMRAALLSLRGSIPDFPDVRE